MNVNDVYESDLLKATDLQNMEHTVVIESINLKDYDDGKKLVLKFQHRKKALVLNKTNMRRIEKVHGSETDGWVGREIILYSELVQGPTGGMVEGIRVRMPLKRAPAAQPGNGQTVQQRPGYELSSGAPTPAAERHPNAPGDDLNDPIPF